MANRVIEDQNQQQSLIELHRYLSGRTSDRGTKVPEHLACVVTAKGVRTDTFVIPAGVPAWVLKGGNSTRLCITLEQDFVQLTFVVTTARVYLESTRGLRPVIEGTTRVHRGRLV